ncbi:MAG: hypothetical protein Q7J25_09965 [Vicinamibacterales bacterium]|nr:hypothetical protein [Vicinamibacterales bacterium]
MVTVFVGVPAHVHGQQPAAQAQTQAPHHPEQGAAAVPDAATPEQRQAMMMNMMSEMKAADAKLDALVQAMNAAKGAAKTDAIAALLTTIVEQQRAMHSSMGPMMHMMHMMNDQGSHDQQPGTPKQ